MNEQNCVLQHLRHHGDPSQNITWVPPEGGGPNYPTM
ncbi:4Fe-4S dicluster domain-containing protein [Rhizobium petrolearium]|nr:4Fe-4S dicluster domain-containing protein [Neorhizobium petrolearium]